MKLVALALAGVSVATSAASPFARWTGEWQLDRAASRLRGEVIRIEQTDTGYRFDLGAVQFTLSDDGAFHPTVAGRETRLLRLGAGRWERVHRVNGREVDRSVLSISRDGRTLTITGERPDSAPETLSRDGTGSGLAGRWRSTRLGGNAADVFSIAAVGGTRLRWGSVAEGNWYVPAVNGPPVRDEGPTATPAATLQVATTAGGGLRWTERVNGRAYRIGTDRLSGHGEVLTESVWPASAPGERQVLVYRRRCSPSKTFRRTRDDTDGRGLKVAGELPDGHAVERCVPPSGR